MAFSNAAKNAALDAIGSNATWISMHTADPGTTGASEVVGGSPAYARVATTWSAASAASKSGSQVTSNIPASTAVGFWGLWTAASGGTFYNGGALPAVESYGAQGTLVFTPTLTATG